ncbi:SDR family NAD(P)-dependent oxidoreductase [Lentzea albidocapillata]|uniref:NADP-dependent 3-hydroxy acid dehydrogenase YdfG n=1 Tax=Lentzea albidocapillata TaxID=40571 RepID=A0A1W2AC76_9PSEU|nr:SDR family NAD(P)-dependent oxidoreductase [Lentzea albidocapillata]SMC58244.1 NADP-dependent 3-hydroxy acid dehydrogenase YdfG [Lentzea albidocapillata]
MGKVIVVTGASSGFGALAVRRLALAGNTVYAGMRETLGRNATAVADLKAFGVENKADVHAVELDVQSQESADAAIGSIVLEQGRLDVVVHNAGHMVTGPAEAFTPEQYANLYDVNVLGTQRVNRAALPHLRGQRSGHVVWVGSSSTRGGTPPYLAPYFAAKAAMDAVAVSYRAELLRFGIETTIVVPGAFTHGTNHFTHSGAPADTSRASEYEELYPGLMDQVGRRLAELEPSWADVGAVADAIVDVVGAAKPPFRVHVDPSSDGAEVVNAVADRVRGEFLRRVELADLI